MTRSPARESGAYVDQFNRQDQEKKQAKPGTGQLKPGTGNLARPGTGNLGGDSFRSTGTGPLNKSASRTGRLASGPLEIEKAIQAMATEVENGSIIINKLEGRIRVLERAIKISDRPVDAAQVLTGISAGEANFTKQVAQALTADPGVKRRVQVATYQFEQARKGIDLAKDVLDKAAGYDGPAKGQFVENHCHVEKLRGQLYPLVNLHMVFKDHALLSQLIPTPKVQDQVEMEAPPPPPPPPPQAATGPLNAGQLSSDPNVQQMVETINKVTGNLKDKLSGFFKKP